VSYFFAPRFGPQCYPGGVRFRVWAPEASQVELLIEWPQPCRARMTRQEDGFHELWVPGLGKGARYRYLLDGLGPYPDPASRFQPEGVHGPSEVVDVEAFAWTDAGWKGLPLEELIFYEMHVGTFTPEGTFEAARARLPLLKELGITAVQLMPVADFAGRWNWGYDGAAWYAPARCYGRPEELQAFVDEAHRLGLAVFLDVVYNHFGPDGAYAPVFSPYFLSGRQTPWGPAINFDGPHASMVRAFVIENALYWLVCYHMDGLRLDATHAMFDDSPQHILGELASAVKQASERVGRRWWLVAEDHRNLNRLVLPPARAGLGLDAVWSEDFHHALRRLLTGEQDGYFADFQGTVRELTCAVRQGWVFTGQVSSYYGGPRGTDPGELELPQFVFYIQNHDQVGNRPFGQRLHHELDLATWKAASMLLLLAPETPLLFMGQEWAASSPFLFFIDHEPELARSVRAGRRKELSRFAAYRDPELAGRLPDPQDPASFLRSKLNWDEQEAEPHRSVWRFYRDLIWLRRHHPALRERARHAVTVEEAGEDALVVVWGSPQLGLGVVVRLRGEGTVDASHLARRAGWEQGRWNVWLTSEDVIYAGGAQPVGMEIDLNAWRFHFLRPGGVVFATIPPPHAAFGLSTGGRSLVAADEDSAGFSKTSEDR